MEIWKYLCYDDGKQPNLWQRWYDDHREYQGHHDSIFGILEQLTQWREPYTKTLKKGLIEVRINGAVKWRVFGFYRRSVRQEFIIVSTGYHKQQVYTPKEVINTSISIKEDIESGIKKAISCDRPR